MKLCLTIAAAAALFLMTPTVRPKDGDMPARKRFKADEIFLAAVGSADPAAPYRIAQKAACSQIREALYRDDRTVRLAALDAAAFVDDPWPLLPYLAALMGARDRQTSSRAAQSLVENLSKSTGNPTNRFEVIPGQAKQLAEQLAPLVADSRLDLDIRVSSMAAMEMLKKYDRTIGLKADEIAELLNDDEKIIRHTVLASVPTPAAENLLLLLARTAGDRSDPELMGQAAALLCENALAHGAKAPSKDLTDVLVAALGNAEVPAEGIGPIIGCLARFPAEVRAELFDIAIRHPDPAVSRFAKSFDLQ